MRGSRISAVFMAAVIWGCQDDDSNGASGQCTSQSHFDLPVGRATGPTLGPRCSCDSTTRELALSEVDEVLGFSAEDVLEKIEGDYELAMVWGDACEGEDAQTDGCSSEAPDFTGSETEVLISVARAATTARVDDCVGDGQEPQCRITWLIVPVAGTLATSDGLLDEAFEAEMRVRCADEVIVGQTVAPAALGGTLPSRMSGLSRIAWAFGVTEADAVFEVSIIAGTRTRVWAQPPDGGRTRSGHSWGVAHDLEKARQ
jgi:hypothetical protein